MPPGHPTDRLLREGERPVSKTCRFIHAEKANYTVTLLCKVMKTARSTYYAWVAGRKAREARRRDNEALAHEITVIHLASRHNQGVPRVTAALCRGGRLVNRKRVERVMRQHGIAGNSRRTGRRSLTKADGKAAPAPDLIGRDFTAIGPGTKIVGDITCIPTAEGWLCLASWLDLATRDVIGYSMADHHRAELVADVLDMAAALGRLEPGCVIHSDRGSEYTPTQLRTRIGELRHRQAWAEPEAASTTQLWRARIGDRRVGHRSLGFVSLPRRSVLIGADRRACDLGCRAPSESAARRSPTCAIARWFGDERSVGSEVRARVGAVGEGLDAGCRSGTRVDKPPGV
ncbi:IS3 family transposase [Streptomyces mirabilis]|uniref:IS3 family transposase n=1 Tax=Streptomyces mirabilis TaxID=68239 RepID=UPI003685661D